MNMTTNDPAQCLMATEALKQVIDPEIGLNIVDLGLVYRIDFFEDEDKKRIEVDMTLTTQLCPMGEAITESAREMMEESFKDHKIELNLVFDPGWTHNLITQDGHRFLNP